MAENRVDDGRIGKEIDWSLVIPSITRPVWEPPALEVLDYFEMDEGALGSMISNFNSDELKVKLPDPDLRLRVLDSLCQLVPLIKYIGWADETSKAAEEAGKEEKVAFYEGLLKVLTIEMNEFGKGINLWVREYNALGTRTPVAEISDLSDSVGFEDKAGGEPGTSGVESPYSRDAPNDQVATDREAEVRDTPTFRPSTVVKKATPDISHPTNRQSTSIFTTVARTLCCHSQESEDE